jgi:hypothetical protein
VTVNFVLLMDLVDSYDRLLVVKKYANVATDRYMSARESHILVLIRTAELSTLLPRVFSRAKMCNLVTGQVGLHLFFHVFRGS